MKGFFRLQCDNPGCPPLMAIEDSDIKTIANAHFKQCVEGQHIDVSSWIESTVVGPTLYTVYRFPPKE